MFDGLIFKVANREETGRALELRREVYTAELGHDGIDAFDERAHHLVACETDGQIVAALRIVGPECRPFDMEHLIVLADFLPAERLPAEVARFCVHREHRRIQRGNLLHVGMLKLAFAFARKHGLTDFVTLALPDLRNLYRFAFFEELGPRSQHSIWGTVHPMRLDLLGLARRCSESREPLARLLVERDPPNIVV